MKELEKECSFLSEKGFYRKTESQFIIYTRDSLEIFIGCEPCDKFNVFIKFTDVNETYDVGFIGIARDGRSFDAPSEAERAVLLIDYLKGNFDNLTSRTYCEESREYIAKYIAENRALLDKARADFLSRVKK